MAIVMPRILLYLFSAALLATTPIHAKLSLNPLNWFSDSEIEAVPDYVQEQKDLENSALASLEKGREQLNRNKKRSAIRIFKKIAKLYPTTNAAAEARFLHASIRMDREQFVRAHELLQQIIFENPAYEEFDTVIATQFQCATALMEGARGKLLFVFPGFLKYGEAIKQFEYVVANAPYGDYAPLALMNIALIAQQEKESDLAIDALDRLINYYPQSALAPDAYYHLAKTYSELVSGHEYDQGSTRQAISYYEDLLALFPENENIGTVEANLAEMENLLASSRLELGDFFYLYRNNNTAALTFYNEAITLAPESEAAIEASERIANIEAGVRPVTGSKLLRKLLMAN
jgi:outer membrane protein assembly factor BamD